MHKCMCCSDLEPEVRPPLPAAAPAEGHATLPAAGRQGGAAPLYRCSRKRGMHTAVQMRVL